MKIAVIGAGTMGHGIAQVAAVAGYTVALQDMNGEALRKAKARIEENLQGGVLRGKITEDEKVGALGRIEIQEDLEKAVAGAELVIEAILENLEAKQGVLKNVAALVDAGTILASNTSSLPITQIASAISNPERVIGMHFFNPVHIMKLIEVVVHDTTLDAVRDRVLDVTRTMGKEPIVVKDSPGFASSRLGVVLGLEAMRMVEQGVASPEDIDKAMELGYKHPMGPLRLTDLVGLDVRLAIAESLHRDLGGDQYAPPAILKNKVEAGELGKKTGTGFYRW